MAVREVPRGCPAACLIIAGGGLQESGYVTARSANALNETCCDGITATCINTMGILTSGRLERSPPQFPPVQAIALGRRATIS